MITVSLIGDVASLFAIRYQLWLTPWFVKAVCKTYLVCLICGSWSTLIYILADLLPQNKHKKIGVPMILLIILESALILLTPIYIYDQADQVYTYGPSVMVNYLFNVVHIISILTVTYVFRKKLNPRRRFSITLWMLIWIVAAGIQFMNNERLLVGFASALGVLILFTVIENPESNLDRRLGCFNSYALNEYLIEMYETRKDFSLLEISLDNLKAFEERGIDTNEIMKKLVSLCKKDVLLFKNIQLSLVLTSPDKESLTASAEAVMNEFSDSDIFLESATLTLIPHANSFGNPDELFRFLAFVQNECIDKRGTLIHATDALISKFRDQYLIEQEIRDALAEDRAELFLQPIYSNNERCFTSAEALMRIRKRDNELLSPGLFIPIAEKNGQIVELGERIFEKVCDFLKNTDATNLGIHYIEVNLSVVQCESENLSDQLISIVNKYQISPGLINLEITETASIRARKILLENMKKLISYGFTFSLDDFGKGESNLMYVVEMPVSIIKLDYDMSKAFFNSSKAKQVVQAVLEMSHGMSLKVVAEGIETREELDQITAEGVDYIQGYYYSRPLPVMDFLRFLQDS
ncbi:MAG: EAL domain-containing protein [Lachnospiraceae bacterium]|nr:EAL domain-containing protein [Lachnospiraceae bacterium]